MMNHYLFVAIIAGLATALLNFSGLVGGVVGIGFILVLISSLPIMIAGLGWGSFTGLIAAFVSALAISGFVGIKAGTYFLLLNSLPAWWLCRLALLNRPISQNGEVEFYPVSRLLIWIAGLSSAIVIITFMPLVLGENGYEETISSFVKTIYGSQPIIAPGGESIDIDLVASIFAGLAPTVSSILLILSLVITLYLAGKVTRKSNRLPRPWPDLHRITMPIWSVLIFLAAVFVLFVDGTVGLMAQIVASAFGMALFLVGLSVIHYMTRNKPSRPLILWMNYLFLIVFAWTGLIVMALGIAEIFIGIRARFPRPPAGSSGGPNTLGS